MNFIESVRLRIAQLQEEKGWNDAELSRRSQIAKSTLSTIKNNPAQCPSFLVLGKMLCAFGISLYDFFKSPLFEEYDGNGRAGIKRYEY